MCGIAGIWSRADAEIARLQCLAVTMRDAIAHRGPDDAGVHVEPAGIVLAHRRLSIVDLSPAGHQPMESASGRYVIAFNGEVYNHRSIRASLPWRAYRGTSDTETMLAAIEAHGLDRALRSFVGMFAFALWDRVQRELHLVRDRVGIKPLYWGHAIDGSLLWGSEMRALLAHPRFDTTIDREALARYFETSCVPAPLTIHRAARKLEPATILTFVAPDAAPRARRFWHAAEGTGRAAPRTPAEAIDEAEALLRDAVQLRLLADVPVGAFLSGGIDSSVVVALAREVSAQTLRTYSIGTESQAYDESADAARIARLLGTEHTALRVSDAEARAVVPRLGAVMDEPLGDSSLLPTYLVSELARRDVTVALSGDGGDEVFGGYNRHVWGPRVLRGARSIPPTLALALARAIERVSADRWDLALGALAPGTRLPGDKLLKLARTLSSRSVGELHAALRLQWVPSPVVGAEAAGPPRVVDADVVRALCLLDLGSYLPDDILTKVDRASMAVALEARVPILDHRVVELGVSLPARWKVQRGRGKWLLREILARRLPSEVFERPKTGFSVPIGDWLRGPLLRWADDLLDARALADAGLDATLVRRRWDAHRARRAQWGLALWDVICWRLYEERLSRRAAELLPMREVRA